MVTECFKSQNKGFYALLKLPNAYLCPKTSIYSKRAYLEYGKSPCLATTSETGNLVVKQTNY